MRRLLPLLLLLGCAAPPKARPDAPPPGPEAVFVDGVEPSPTQIHVCGMFRGAFACMSMEHYMEVARRAQEEKAQANEM